MAGAGVAVREAVPAFALSTGEAAERVLGIVARAAQHEVVHHGPNAYRLTRHFRPLWSVVTLFTATSTEICDITVSLDPPTGHTVVFLSGRLPEVTLEAIRLALGGSVPVVTAAPPAYTGPAMPAMGAPPAPGPPMPQQPPMPQYQGMPQQPAYPPAPQQQPMMQPPVPQPMVAQPPMAPNPAYPPAPSYAQPRVAPATTTMATSPVAAAPPAGPGRPQTVVVELDDGRRASLGLLVLVGRNPAAAPDEFAAQLVAVDDEGRSVSKTHLAIGSDDRGVWVVDRHSTNGTAILQAGQPVRCSPGERVYLQLPATVRFGDRTLRVVAD